MVSVIFTVLFFTCFTQFSSLFPFTEANDFAGFSVNLIHRDSPASPFYKPLETELDRFYNAYNRSISRINRFKRSSSSTAVLQSHLVASGGEYFMYISLGTPAVTVLGLADTGSDLTWVQCKPCTKCYKQTPPLFDPQKSSTYGNLSCSSASCNELGASSRVCNQQLNQCGYNYTYGDGSFTTGNVALETFTLSSTSGSLVSFPKIVFGCGHSSGGIFDPTGAGIVGLGGSPLSLISQMGSAISKKFSYCLAPVSTSRSKITFGIDGMLSSSNTVSTPLVAKNPSEYYYVTLEAISVANQRLPYQGPTVASKGNIIIDTGTTMSMLDSQFFGTLQSALEKAIGAKHVKDPRGYLSPCFKGISETSLPTITMHFSGADVKLSNFNTFSRLQEDLLCFTMVPVDDVAIYGNLCQTNFVVGFDLGGRTVSFNPMDCSKY